MSQTITKFIANNAVTNAKLAQIPANSIKGNNTGSPADASDLTVLQVNLLLGDILANGSVPFTADQSLGSHKLTNVTDPSGAQDAATKSYVDNAVAALNPEAPVFAATTTNLVGTYNNGAAGIGATFTITATGAFVVDGVTPSINSRILIKDQSSAFQNGVYVLTVTGSLGISPILTRALDYNTPALIDAAGLIPVINGTVNALSSWALIAPITTIGTDSLTYQLFTANPSLFLLKANNLNDVASKSASFDALSPMTTGGDLIYGGVSGTGTRLPNGSSGQVLTSAGGTSAPAWMNSAGVTTIGTIDGNTASANGLSISGSSLFAQSASATNPGMVNIGTQTMAGAKTFSTTVITPIFKTTASDVATSGALRFGNNEKISWRNATNTTDLTLTLNPSNILETTASMNVIGQLTAANLSGTNQGDISFNTVGSSPNASGASLSVQVVTLQPADGTHPGLITSGTQTLGGNKTFTGSISSSNLSGTNTGDISLAAVGASPNANAASLSGQVLNLQPFGSAQPGVVLASGGGTSNFLRADGTWAAPSGATSGTVTSVALADSTGIFNISGSPVTTSGTLTLASLQSQAANTFLAAPNGSSGAPTFRLIVAADIPTLNQNTTGTASNITASSNSTLTTLSALSLPGAQVTGNIAGNAANITASSNSTLTTLSALSLPGAQVTGNIPGNAANVTGVVAVVNGGTGQTTYTDGQLLIGDTSSGGLDKATLTAGANVTITNGNGSITIAASNTGASNLVSKTTTYTALTTDSIILCSSSAFTVTLFTAVGNTGKVLTIKKTDTSISNIITITPNGGQTIDALASYLLNTQSESVTIVSDGSNWQVLDHKCDTADSTNVLGSVVYDNMGSVTGSVTTARRIGNNMVLRGSSLAGTTVAAAFAINVPAGSTIDTAKLSASGNQVGLLTTVNAGGVTFAGGTGGPFPLFYDGATNSKIFVANSGATHAYTKLNAATLVASGNLISWECTIPITNWQP